MGQWIQKWTIGLVIGFPILVLFLLIEAFVFKSLWLWFAVPAFSLAPLSLLHCMGLSMIVGLLSYQYIPKQSDPPVFEEIPGNADASTQTALAVENFLSAWEHMKKVLAPLLFSLQMSVMYYVVGFIIHMIDIHW